jgi:hypothetical protein
MKRIIVDAGLNDHNPGDKRIMRLGVILITWVCLGVGAASAEILTLSTSAPVGNPLVVNAGAISGAMVITVTNNTNSDVSTDLLTGWQVTLSIVADPGTTGSLTYNTATEPANYILPSFGAASGLGNTDTQLQMFDSETPVVAVQVPTSSGANLLEVTLEASNNALGTFGIFAIDGVDSLWTDANSPRVDRDFGNVPTGGGAVRIGEIRVVPEPGGLMVWGFVGGVLGLAHRRTMSRCFLS